MGDGVFANRSAFEVDAARFAFPAAQNDVAGFDVHGIPKGFEAFLQRPLAGIIDDEQLAVFVENGHLLFERNDFHLLDGLADLGLPNQAALGID